jgi:DNA-binding NarL/FixJ family response regulator
LIIKVSVIRLRDLGMGVKRVIIVLDESVIGRGVERLLSREMDLNVTGVPFIDDKALIDLIEKIQPDVVIVDGSLIFGRRIDFLSLLRSGLNMSVLVLSNQDNRINIYNHQEILVTQSTDLISAIRGN